MSGRIVKDVVAWLRRHWPLPEHRDIASAIEAGENTKGEP